MFFTSYFLINSQTPVGLALWFLCPAHTDLALIFPGPVIIAQLYIHSSPCLRDGIVDPSPCTQTICLGKGDSSFMYWLEHHGQGKLPQKPSQGHIHLPCACIGLCISICGIHHRFNKLHNSISLCLLALSWPGIKLYKDSAIFFTFFLCAQCGIYQVVIVPWLVDVWIRFPWLKSKFFHNSWLISAARTTGSLHFVSLNSNIDSNLPFSHL
jgi:hypothetical protein